MLVARQEDQSTAAGGTPPHGDSIAASDWSPKLLGEMPAHGDPNTHKPPTSYSVSGTELTQRHNKGSPFRVLGARTLSRHYLSERNKRLNHMHIGHISKNIQYMILNYPLNYPPKNHHLKHHLGNSMTGSTVCAMDTEPHYTVKAKTASVLVLPCFLLLMH